MADKSKTIKNASDEELKDLIMRLRQERELQELVISLRRNSEENPGKDYETSYRGIPISTETPIEELYHHGVLGMKWGVRTDGKSGSKGSSKRSRDSRVASSLRRKKLSEMSNEELQTLSKRLNLEKNVRSLNKRQVSAGEKFVTGVLVAAGSSVATVYATKGLTAGAEKLISAAKKN